MSWKEKSERKGNLGTDIVRTSKAELFSFPISSTDSAIMLDLRDELNSLEKCMAYPYSPEEREMWKKKYQEASTKHSIQLERILKQYASINFQKEINVPVGVDFINDRVFTHGWMKW